MKIRISAVALALTLAPSLFAGHHDKGQTVVTRYDAPMATTFYRPDGVPTVRQQIRFKIYPYLGQKGGKVWFRLVIGVPFIPNSYPSLRGAALTVDGGDSFTLDFAGATIKDDGVFMKVFDRGGDDLEQVVRRVAQAKDVWLVVLAPPSGNNHSYTRVNLHLVPEQIETFRMMVEKADALKTESAASNADAH